MAELCDYRMSGSDETLVTLESYMNDNGDIIVNLKEQGADEEGGATVFIKMNLMEAKRLCQSLQETINYSVAELTQQD